VLTEKIPGSKRGGNVLHFSAKGDEIFLLSEGKSKKGEEVPLARMGGGVSLIRPGHYFLSEIRKDEAVKGQFRVPIQPPHQAMGIKRAVCTRVSCCKSNSGQALPGNFIWAKGSRRLLGAR